MSHPFPRSRFTVHALLCAGLLSVSTATHAIMPGTDYVNLGQKILENMEVMSQHKERLAQFKGALDQATQMFGLKMDAENNAQANAMARKDMADADIQNKEMLEASLPAANACSPIAVNLALNEVACIDSDYQSRKESENRNIDSPEEARQKRANGLPTSTLQDKYNAVIERAKDSRPHHHVATSRAERADLMDAGANNASPYALDPYYLVSSNPETLSLSRSQRVALEDFILLVAPPYAPSVISDTYEPLSDSVKVNNLSRALSQNLANQAFTGLLSLRVSEDDESPSKLELLQFMADKQFTFGPDGRNSVSAKISESNLAMPSLIYRNLAVMKAFRVHMSVEAFKKSLDQELLLTTRLSNELK